MFDKFSEGPFVADFPFFLPVTAACFLVLINTSYQNFIFYQFMKSRAQLAKGQKVSQGAPPRIAEIRDASKGALPRASKNIDLLSLK